MKNTRVIAEKLVDELNSKYLLSTAVIINPKAKEICLDLIEDFLKSNCGVVRNKGE